MIVALLACLIFSAALFLLHAPIFNPFRLTKHLHHFEDKLTFSSSTEFVRKNLIFPCSSLGTTARLNTHSTIRGFIPVSLLNMSLW